MGRKALTKWELAAVRYFVLLRDNYAGYDPSGGDGRFSAAFRSLAEDLDRRGDSLDSTSFARALADSLAFLSDGHFTIRGGDFSRSLGGQVYWYTTGEDWLLERRGSGFRFLSGPLAGADVAPRMTAGDATIMARPTIDREGRVAWRLVASRCLDEGESPVDLCLDVPVKRLGKTAGASIVFIVDDFCPSGGGEAWSISPTGYGRYAKYATFMYVDDAGRTAQAAFADRLPELRTAPVFVFDLRGNMGGHSDVIDAWIASFCGTTLPLCLYDLQTARDGRIETADAAWRQLAPHLDAMGMLPRVKGPNKVLFILMDHYCCSSTEDAIRELSILDGALLVGMPTSGMLACGDNSWYRDEETGTGIFFGNNRRIWYPQDWRALPEGQGIEPDLWVPTTYARERAEALVARYGDETLSKTLRR